MSESRDPQEIRAPQMAPLSRLPVFLALEGKRAVVAGGNAAAAWKAELLSATGAIVDVYAEKPGESMRQLAVTPPRGAINIHRRAWTPADLQNAAIAIGACDDDEQAEAFASAARAAGTPVNVIDKPAYCDFAFGSIVNRSPMVIGISTDGAAPVFAQAIRAKLEALLPQGFAQWAEAAKRWRPQLQLSGLSFAGRRRFWHVFTAHAMTHAGNAPNENDFERFLAEVQGLGAAVESGSVTLVGAGPGDPELLTLRAVRALQSADVILFDDLVSSEVLDFARREAKKMLVGKTGYGPSCKQDDINTLMVNLAKSGKRVVRLKGGDPMIFGRAGEEIEACRAAGIAADVVPGITAAQGTAAKLGVSLTERNSARRVQYVTGHAKDGALPRDIDWRSLTDPATTTAIYMPKQTLAALVDQGLREGLDAATPAVAVVRATRPDQVVIADRISALPARLADAKLDGPVLVMLGQVFAPQLEAAVSPGALRSRA